MSEETSYIPSLTLEPNAQAVAAVAVEAKEEEKLEDIPVERLELNKLSPAEQAAVTEFAKKIDVLNTEQVLNYGSNAQKNISEFSDAALSAVRTKDLGEVTRQSLCPASRNCCKAKVASTPFSQSHWRKLK